MPILATSYADGRALAGLPTAASAGLPSHETTTAPWSGSRFAVRPIRSPSHLKCGHREALGCGGDALEFAGGAASR